MTDPNRIGSPTTVANAAENARLAPVSPPGEGGWTPAQWMPMVASLAIGILSSVGAVVALPGLTVPVLMGALMVGLSTGLSTFFGIKSAGPRKVDQ